jgi:hypothetical protein
MAVLGTGAMTAASPGCCVPDGEVVSGGGITTLAHPASNSSHAGAKNQLDLFFN